MRRHDLIGRILGIIVFLGGIAVLAFVFMTAYHFFQSPLGEIKPPVQGTSATSPATDQLGRSALSVLIRIALLIVMTIVGSLIAGRGVQMYFASSDSTRHRDSITPHD